VICQHRLTTGIGVENFLLQGMDFDVFLGGLLSATDEFGNNTLATVAAYYAGAGLTWHFGPCSRTP